MLNLLSVINWEDDFVSRNEEKESLYTRIFNRSERRYGFTVLNDEAYSYQYN